MSMGRLSVYEVEEGVLHEFRVLSTFFLRAGEVRRVQRLRVRFGILGLKLTTIRLHVAIYCMTM